MADRIKPNLRTPGGAGFCAKHPVFPAVAALKKDLGRVSQYILVNELSVREFGAQATNNSLGVEEHVNSVSSNHGINVSLADFKDILGTLPNWYIVLDFIVIDSMLRRLIKEICKHKKMTLWKKSLGDQKLSPLEQLDENQPLGPKRLKHYDEYAVLNYYRLLRNEIIHPIHLKQRPAVAAHTALHATSATYLTKAYKLRGAPHAPDELTFDDHFLLSQVASAFSLVISDAYQLTVDEILDVVRNDEKLWKQAKHSGSGNREDFSNFLADFYFKTYQRWNDPAAIEHCKQFKEMAGASLFDSRLARA